MNDTAFVYRVFDERGQLLYIGCTSDFDARKAVHMATHNTPIAYPIQMWGKRWDVEEHPSLKAARAAERGPPAIESEARFLNRHYNTKRWTRVANEWVPLMPLYEPPARTPDPELLVVLAKFAPSA